MSIFDLFNPVSDDVKTNTQDTGIPSNVNNALGGFSEDDFNNAIDDAVRNAKDDPCPESNNDNSTSNHVSGPTLGGTLPLPSNLTEDIQQTIEDNVLSETEAQSENAPAAPASTDDNADSDGGPEGLDDEEIMEQTMSTQELPGLAMTNTGSTSGDPTERDSHVYSLDGNKGHFSDLTTEDGGPMSVSDAIMDFSYNDAKNDGELNYMMGLKPNLTDAMSSTTSMSLDYTSGADSNNGYSSLTTTTETTTLEDLLGGEVGVAVQFDGSENFATDAIHSLAEEILPGVDDDTLITAGLHFDFDPEVDFGGGDALQEEDLFFGFDIAYTF